MDQHIVKISQVIGEASGYDACERCTMHLTVVFYVYPLVQHSNQYLSNDSRKGGKSHRKIHS